MAKQFFVQIALILALTIVSTFAGEISYTNCESTNGFQLNSLSVSTCNLTNCMIHPEQTYQITVEGQDNIAEVITKLLFKCTVEFENNELLQFPIICGDLCTLFTPDSATQSCPVTTPASGKAVVTYQPATGLFAKGTPTGVTCKVWKNSKSTTPDACVKFNIELAQINLQGNLITPFSCLSLLLQ